MTKNLKVKLARWVCKVVWDIDHRAMGWLQENGYDPYGLGEIDPEGPKYRMHVVFTPGELRLGQWLVQRLPIEGACPELFYMDDEEVLARLAVKETES